MVPVDPNCVSFPKVSSFWCHCGSWCGSWYADEIGHLRQVWMTSVDDVHACRQPVDDMHTCGWHVHDTRCSTAWNWATQGSADNVQTTFGCHLHMVRMTCRQHLDVIRTWCRWHADDIWMSSAHGVDDIWMSSAHGADDVRMTYMWNLTPNLTLMLSVRHLHIVCHETSVPRLFSVKEQRTALLKMLIFLQNM